MVLLTATHEQNKWGKQGNKPTETSYLGDFGPSFLVDANANNCQIVFEGQSDQDHEQNTGETTGHSRTEPSNFFSPAFCTCKNEKWSDFASGPAENDHV